MIFEVKVPQISFSDSVKLLWWHVSDGDFVRKGSTLCLVEYNKATLEVEAEKSGFVKTLVQKGVRVPIQETICIIADSLAEIESFYSEPK